MIRWMKLLNQSKVILGSYNITADIDIHLSTAMPENVRANVQGTEVSADILLSAMHNKSEADIIDSIAHELAHLVCHKNPQLGMDKVQKRIALKLREALCVE